MNIDADVLGRARAAFRHAQFHGRVPSTSEFVAVALETEIRRIELEHNGGQRLESETETFLGNVASEAREVASSAATAV